MKDLKLLYERMGALPSPGLAKSIGDFALYEALPAGCAGRLVRDGLLDASKIPLPDAETVAMQANYARRANAHPRK